MLKSGTFVFRLFSVLMLFTLMVGLLGVTPARAAGIRYATAGGSGTCLSWATACTLQTALSGAVSGDEIWVAAGTFKPTTTADRTATFQLKNGVSIYGGFAGTEISRDQRDLVLNVTILSGDINGDDQPGFGNRSDNVYHVVTGSGTDNTAALDGFTISGGQAEGKNSYPKNFGGGMLNIAGSPRVANCTFTNNRAYEGGGGGMANFDGSIPTLSNITFSGNSAVVNNNWGGWGGAMYIADASNLLMTDVSFNANYTSDAPGNRSGWGGGIYIYHSNPTLTNVTFDGNSSGSGGGIINDSGSPTLNSVTFTNNMAGSGGGLYSATGNPVLTNVVFNNNSVTELGGGFYGYSRWGSGNPSLTNVTFSNNLAGERGGGLYLQANTPAISQTTFNGNSALHGGAIYADSSNLTITNVTFANNSATYEGGAIYNSTNTPVLINTTFYGNTANDGGALYNRGNDICGDACANFVPIIRNSLFWANTAVNGAQIYNPYKSYPTISNSVIQNGCPGGSICASVIAANPLLGTFGNYSGFTQTMPLLVGSPAIDAGNDATCAATDQRGVTRPQGAHCDIGAFEYTNQKAWTFLLYLAGDNNLYPYLERAISGLEAQVANANVNIVVLFDGDRTNDSWRFLVQSGGNYTLGVNKWHLGEVNTGNPQTLSDFITWTRQNYPAQHYYLSIADHGRGTSGVAWDDTSNHDYLTTSELRASLNAATNNGQWKIDVLHYDACLMGMLENAYQVKDVASYLVASENLGWSVFDYAQYNSQTNLQSSAAPYEFASLVGKVNATTTPQQLVVSITDAYFNHPSLQNYPRTIAALDLSRAAAVRQAVDTLAGALRTNLNSVKTFVQNTRSATQKFDSRDYYQITQDDEYLDLYHLAEKLHQNVPNSSVQSAAQGVMNAITSGFVIAEHHQSGSWAGEQDVYWDLDNAHGISIYFPPRSGSSDYNAYIAHQKFQFTVDSLWDEFLLDYYGAVGLPPEAGDDPGIPPMLPPTYIVYLPMLTR